MYTPLILSGRIELPSIDLQPIALPLSYESYFWADKIWTYNDTTSAHLQCAAIPIMRLPIY